LGVGGWGVRGGCEEVEDAVAKCEEVDRGIGGVGM